MNILHCEYLHRLANTHTFKQMHVCTRACTHTHNIKVEEDGGTNGVEEELGGIIRGMNMNTIQRIQYETEKINKNIIRKRKEILLAQLLP